MAEDILNLDKNKEEHDWNLVTKIRSFWRKSLFHRLLYLSFAIENNYLDFSDGRLYWRFCADYNEPYIGVGAIPQTEDDPDNQLKINPYGYCPTWNDLSPGQKTRRVPTWWQKLRRR